MLGALRAATERAEHLQHSHATRAPIAPTPIPARLSTGRPTTVVHHQPDPTGEPAPAEGPLVTRTVAGPDTAR